jgi:hypothetical protein
MFCNNNYSDRLFPLQKPQIKKWISLGQSILPKLTNINNKKKFDSLNKMNTTLLNDYISLFKNKNQMNHFYKFQQFHKNNSLNSFKINRKKRELNLRETYQNPSLKVCEGYLHKNKSDNKIYFQKDKNIKNIIFNIQRRNLGNSYEENTFYLTKKYYEKHKDKKNITVTKLNDIDKRMKIIFNFKKFSLKKIYDL